MLVLKIKFWISEFILYFISSMEDLHLKMNQSIETLKVEEHLPMSIIAQSNPNTYLSKNIFRIYQNKSSVKIFGFLHCSVKISTKDKIKRYES